MSPLSPSVRVESKRRRARGEPRSSAGRRGRPRKAENLPDVLPIQKEEEEEEDESVQEVPQPPAEEPLPEAENAGLGTISYSPLLPPAYVPTAPVLLPDVAPAVAYSSTSLFPLAPTLTPTPAPALTLTLTPTPAPASTLTPTPAPGPVPTVVPIIVPEPTVPQATSSQSPSLPAPSGASQTEAPLEAVLDLAPAPAPLVVDAAPVPAPPSAVVYTTESSTREALGQVTIEDLGPDELEDVRSPQKEVAVERFNTGMRALQSNFIYTALLKCNLIVKCNLVVKYLNRNTRPLVVQKC